MKFRNMLLCARIDQPRLLSLYLLLGVQMCWVVCTIVGAATAGGVHSPVGDGGRWRWPEGQDIRIDTKVQFLEATTAANRATPGKSVTASVSM